MYFLNEVHETLKRRHHFANYTKNTVENKEKNLETP